MDIEEVEIISDKGKLSVDGVEYTRVYHVYFTGDYDPAFFATYAGSDLPKPGEERVGDTRAKVSEVEFDLHPEDGGDNKGVAVYTVTYASPTSSDDTIIDPLDRPAVIEGEAGDLTEVCYVDTETEDPIQNSAGRLYETMPETPVRSLNFTITRNEDENPWENADNFSNTVNSATWYGVSEKKALLGKITFSPAEENGVKYWVVRYPISLRATDDWRTRIVDNGDAPLNDDDNPQTWTDDFGNTSRVPCYLNGSGKKLPDGNPPVIYPEGGWNTLYKTNWATLSLPDPFGEL